jgi:hypothetical protein
MVDGAPQIHPFPGDPNDHLVEVPSRARAWAALSQLARDRRAEFQHPAPHRFIGDVEPTLGQQFLYVSVAQGEAEIKPNCVLNDLGRKAMSAVGERSHLDILSGTPLPRLRFRDNALVLRLETTTNDVSAFKHYRKVEHRQGPPTRALAPVRKTIYSLIDLREIVLGCNRRYLEYLSSLDDFSAGIRALDRLTQPRPVKGRNLKGLNF